MASDTAAIIALMMERGATSESTNDAISLLAVSSWLARSASGDWLLSVNATTSAPALLAYSAMRTVRLE